jgi:hypothetical protein
MEGASAVMEFLKGKEMIDPHNSSLSLEAIPESAP